MAEVKKTRLLVAELSMIAHTITSAYCCDILNEAAQRLPDLERIAEFYQAEATRLAELVKGGKKR